MVLPALRFVSRGKTQYNPNSTIFLRVGWSLHPSDFRRALWPEESLSWLSQNQSQL